MLRIVGVFKKCATFATANEKRLVPWMSGLVSGLQTVYGGSNPPGTSK